MSFVRQCFGSYSDNFWQFTAFCILMYFRDICHIGILCRQSVFVKMNETKNWIKVSWFEGKKRKPGCIRLKVVQFQPRPPLLSYHITSRDTTRCDRIAQLPPHYTPHSGVELGSCHGVEARRAFARRATAMPTCVLRVLSVNFLFTKSCVQRERGLCTCMYCI